MKFIIPLVMMACANLAAILDACSGNRGTASEVIKAYMIAEEDVTAIPAAVNHVVSTDVTLEAGKVWFKISLDNVGSSYNFATQGEGQAKFYLNTAVIFVAGVSAEVTNAIDSLIRGKALFIIEDKNGKKHLIGNVNDGANVAIVAQNDRNGYTLTVTWQSSHMPYFYTGAITLV